jgi:hypothetical protein
MFLTVNRNIDGYAMVHQADSSMFFVVRVTLFSWVFMNNISAKEMHQNHILWHPEYKFECVQQRFTLCQGKLICSHGLPTLQFFIFNIAASNSGSLLKLLNAMYNSIVFYELLYRLIQKMRKR